MRRALSIFLVLLFGLGPLSATLEAGEDARLPPCCRRHGAHHCAMSDATIARMIEAESVTPAFTAPAHCPYDPANLSGLMAPMHALARSTAIPTVLLAQAHSPADPRAAACLSPDRTRAGRGPPASI